MSDIESWSKRDEFKGIMGRSAIVAVGCAGIVLTMFLLGANELLAGRAVMAVAGLLCAFTIVNAGVEVARARYGRKYDEVTPPRPPVRAGFVKPGTPAPPASESAKASATALLERAIQLRDETRAAYAEWDSDLAAVLFERPLLRVATEPATAAFNEAFDVMLDVVPDAPSGEVPARDAQRILDAAQAAWDAWVAASKHALREGLGTMSDEERAAIDQAKKLLAVAANAGATDEERHGAIRRVIATLTAVTHRPQAAIEREVFGIVDGHLAAIGGRPLQPSITAAEAAPRAGRAR